MRDGKQMSSPCLGTLDILQSLSIRCFGAHPMKKASHRKETKVHLWTRSSNVDKQGNQDVKPVEHVVSRK